MQVDVALFHDQVPEKTAVVGGEEKHLGIRAAEGKIRFDAALFQHAGLNGDFRLPVDRKVYGAFVQLNAPHAGGNPRDGRKDPAIFSFHLDGFLDALEIKDFQVTGFHLHFDGTPVFCNGHGAFANVGRNFPFQALGSDQAAP